MNRLSLSPVRRHRGDDFADDDDADAEEYKLQKQQQTSAYDASADADAKNNKSIRRMRYVVGYDKIMHCIALSCIECMCVAVVCCHDAMHCNVCTSRCAAGVCQPED